MFFYLCLRVYLGGVAPSEYSRRGWNAERQDGRIVVVGVGENSPATNVVQEGDVIVAIWSERPSATPLVAPGLWRVPPGTQFKLTVSRDWHSAGIPLSTHRILTKIPSGGP